MTILPVSPSPLRWADALDQSADSMRRLLMLAIRTASVSGYEGAFVRVIEAWAREAGLETDLWQSDEADLAAYPQSRQRHLPLAGRPTLVIKLPGRGGGRSLLFNAHSDVVAAGDASAWRHGPWSGAEADGRFYGRGACDDKGPLISALWAISVLRREPALAPAGDVLLELVPGEEDAVGLGTLTSVARGYRADGAVILEPTENIPRRASRGGCRFEIECRGRAVHGTAKWLGVDAIGRMRRVFDALDRMEAAWNDRAADPCFAAYPITRPITVDEVHGGAWQGMVCDACSCAGYLELLPNDDLESWQRGFCERLRAELGGTDGGPEALTIRFSEQYRGHCTDAANPIWEAACGAMESFGGPAGDLIGAPAGFNAGCEAGLRAALHGTPTLVWGPGSLAHAHAPDEFIEFAEVRRGALQFLELIRRWSSQEAL